MTTSLIRIFREWVAGAKEGAAAILLVFVMLVLCPTRIVAQGAVAVRGAILDAGSGELLPARLTIQSESGDYYLARSTSSEGSTVHYQKDRGGSVEIHSSLSAHPFVADLAPGRYMLTVERGKEYIPESRFIEVRDQPVTLILNLRRWIHMAEQGWFSGDTHVHRTLEELPNVVLAEDLNVALPLTYWVTDFDERPSQNNKNPIAPPPAKLIEVDPTHVIWPVNTEYEIFTVKRQRHTLGAVFILNHSEPFDLIAQPVSNIAAEARAQGGILDLDKHNWPWSMMLLPTMNVDLFELTNNHLWRTEFLFKTWYLEYAPDYMNIEMDGGGFTERGWMHFGFQTYYALLNCGFEMMPSGGTASGVHPVPLGFGRVYVQLDGGFDYDRWMRGLKAGRSFVTTGPMLMVTYDGNPPGHRLQSGRASRSVKIAGVVESEQRIDRIEIIVNGVIARTVRPKNRPREGGGFHSAIDVSLKTSGSSWLATRCFERLANGRERFAHTAPVFVDVDGQPLRPRRVEVQYLIKRVEDELTRHREVLPQEALAEYEMALEFYRGKLGE